MAENERETCPECGTVIHDPTSDLGQMDVMGGLPDDPRQKRFKWWVTPMNVLLSCFFIAAVDFVTGPNTGGIIKELDWAFWPLLGFLMLYLAATALTKRPESFWIIGPLFCVEIALLMYFVDRAYGSNDGSLGMDWAQVPMLVLLIFGFAIPVVSRVGFNDPSPEERFKRLVGEAE